MDILRYFAFLITLSWALTACGGGSSQLPVSGNNPPTASEVTFSGIGTSGIFDPSVTYDPNSQRLWMSYSYVEPSIYFNTNKHFGVGIRLAWSDDGGSRWTDAGVVVSAFSDRVVGPLPSVNPALNIAANSHGTWKSEMSSLVYDANAPASERWKIIWLQYLKANGKAYFVDYSWVAMKMAASPAELATATTIKLFSGIHIQTAGEQTTAPAFSPAAGPALIALNADITNAIAGTNTSELDSCIWAEPDLMSDGDGLHLTLNCQYLNGATTDNYIVMFSCDKPCDMTQASHWTYKGRVLTPSHASSLGYRSFSAADLSKKGSAYYLMVTPVRDVAEGAYDGCRVYQFDNFNNASLLQSQGKPVEVLRYDGLTNVHNGACSAHENMTEGLLHSQFRDDTPPQLFHMLQTHIDFP